MLAYPLALQIISRNNLPIVKNGVHVVNVDEYKSIGTHWISLHVNAENVRYFYSLGVNIFQKKLKNS